MNKEMINMKRGNVFRMIVICLVGWFCISGCCRQVSWRRLDHVQALGEQEGLRYETLVRHLGIPEVVLEIPPEDQTMEGEKWWFCYTPEQKKKTRDLGEWGADQTEVEEFRQEFEDAENWLWRKDLSEGDKARLDKGEFYIISEEGKMLGGCFCSMFLGVVEE